MIYVNEDITHRCGFEVSSPARGAPSRQKSPCRTTPVCSSTTAGTAARGSSRCRGIAASFAPMARSPARRSRRLPAARPSVRLNSAGPAGAPRYRRCCTDTFVPRDSAYQERCGRSSSTLCIAGTGCSPAKRPRSPRRIRHATWNTFAGRPFIRTLTVHPVSTTGARSSGWRRQQTFGLNSFRSERLQR